MFKIFDKNAGVIYGFESEKAALNKVKEFVSFGIAFEFAYESEQEDEDEFDDSEYLYYPEF